MVLKLRLVYAVTLKVHSFYWSYQTTHFCSFHIYHTVFFCRRSILSSDKIANVQISEHFKHILKNLAGLKLGRSICVKRDHELQKSYWCINVLRLWRVCCFQLFWQQFGKEAAWFEHDNSPVRVSSINSFPTWVWTSQTGSAHSPNTSEIAVGQASSPNTHTRHWSPSGYKSEEWG